MVDGGRGRGAGVREMILGEPAIIRATDLGGVGVLKGGAFYLLTDELGDVSADARGLGLYCGDTRVVSRLELRFGWGKPALLGSGGDDWRGTVRLSNPECGPEPGPALAARSIGIARERSVAGGLSERVVISNRTADAVPVAMELSVGVDDADIFEVRGYLPRGSRGERLPTLVREDGRIAFRYRGLDGLTRLTRLDADRPDTVSPAPGAPGALALRWGLVVPPGGAVSVGWRVRTSLAPTGDEAALDPFAPAEAAPAPRNEPSATAVVSGDADFDRVVSRALSDLDMLSTPGPGPGETYIAAGVPWYTALFGRDSLIAGLQTLAFRPAIALAALDAIAARQAAAVDDWRDAQPGKMLHELRTGEMARSGAIPHTPYYGSADSTPLWLVLLAAAYDWTGDRAMVERLWPNALAALRWIDEYGAGPDGFVAYERRSPLGLLNQGWKDRAGSICDRRGVAVDSPVALAEVQGYVYAAKLGMARLSRTRGDTGLASRLEAEAAGLRDRFEAAFWLPDERFYAMAIGAGGRLADAIGSNAGHCLWSGIVSPGRAVDVAARLAGPGMDSGWGVRTYAAGQPAYNPMGYHTGSVWPHDNGIAVAGLRRYGFDEEADMIARQVFGAAGEFRGSRLPELYCGFGREAGEAPVPYPVTCSPQAWAAGAPLHMLSSLLGLDARADAGELVVSRPRLPSWLDTVRVEGIAVGGTTADLSFRRRGAETLVEVARSDPGLRVLVL